MEANSATTNGTKHEGNGNDATVKASPQPQRERKTARRSMEKQQPEKSVPAEQVQNGDGSTEASVNNKPQVGHQKPFQKGRKPFYKSGIVEEETSDVPEDNSNSRPHEQRDRRQKSNTKRYEPKDSFDKQNAKKTREKKEATASNSGFNERFDNSGGVLEEAPDPARAAQLAEARRLQQLIPTGLPEEIAQKVQKVAEVVPGEFHSIYAVLESCGFDEAKTIEYLLHNKKNDRRTSKEEEEEDLQNKVLPGVHWTNIVKRGLKAYSDSASSSGYHGSRQHQQHSSQHVSRETIMNMVQENMNAMPGMDTEAIVSSLASAIALQLEQIQRQTQMLFAMQSELNSITQAGGDEVNQLLEQKRALEQREKQLYEELNEVKRRLRKIDLDLENKHKEKSARITQLAEKSKQIGILKEPVFDAASSQTAVEATQHAPRGNYQPRPQGQGRPPQGGNYQNRDRNQRDNQKDQREYRNRRTK